jgi:type IV secretory pathway VirB4 component
VATGGLVVWDRWAADNYNTVILARSGAGKSYLAKLDLLRNLHTGVHAAVIDPEDEYGRLADAVGGSTIRLGAPGVRLNPLDLTTVATAGAGSAGAARGPGGRRSDELTRRALFCHTLISVLLGTDLDPAGRAALDRAIITAYAAAGITSDPRTWRRRPPLLADVTTALANDRDPAGPELAARLEPFVTGSWAGLFDGPTTTADPAEHLVVWSLRELPDELKAAGTLLALDRIWTGITTSGTGSSARAGAGRRRRLVVVDEAWTLMQSEHGARFLFRMAKASRKHWAGLTVITQDPADLLGTDLGQAVVANAATQILLRHAPQAAPTVAKAFNLTAGERAWLTAASRGHGLLLGGGAGDRVVFEALASAEEDRLVTTDPTHLDDPTDPTVNDLDADLLGGDGVGDARDGEGAFDDASYDGSYDD